VGPAALAHNNDFGELNTRLSTGKNSKKRNPADRHQKDRLSIPQGRRRNYEKGPFVDGH
jgi:hypothetical protein